MSAAHAHGRRPQPNYRQGALGRKSAAAIRALMTKNDNPTPWTLSRRLRRRECLVCRPRFGPASMIIFFPFLGASS